uniref:Uncharacterized protein n=1 Tax=Plectus sambesii TaxID=2011161 RepID=A0A914VI88_9BILA
MANFRMEGVTAIMVGLPIFVTQWCVTKVSPMKKAQTAPANLVIVEDFATFAPIQNLHRILSARSSSRKHLAVQTLS